MIITKTKLLRSLFIILFLGTFIPIQAQCLPSLGAASGFVIYTAAGAVTNTAISTISGDIGTNVGAITGFGTAVLTGSFHNSNTLTQTAAQDLSSAYNAFQNLTPTVTNHASVFGNGEIITAGVYSLGSAATIVGTLTLDAQNNPDARFIFQIGGALDSSAGANIVLINGATSNNIYWIVLNACGLGANTTFFGTVMAGATVAAGANCEVQGKLLSVAGAISIYNTNLSNNGNTMFYADADLDGYGNPAISSCVFVSGYVNNDKDCSDSNASVNPTATEIWGNLIDENCDGVIFRPQEQSLPSLGAASEFTLYTGAGAISHSATVSNITGNIGTNEGAITGFELSNVTGTFINANAITQTAKQDLISAFTMFQSLVPTVTDHAPAFGSETLTAGIYSIGGAGSIAGVLVLDGQNNCENKFVFKFGGAFTTGAGSSVVLINGALSKNIYWIADGAAGLAANVSFNGTIINNAALSVGLDCQLNGKLLTTAGAITAVSSNLVNNFCPNSGSNGSTSPLSGSISGLFALSANSGNQSYTATIAGAMCYTWTLPAGWNVAAGSSLTSNPIVVTVGSAGGNLSVIATDGCSASGSAVQAVTVSSGTSIWNGTSWDDAPVAGKNIIFQGNYSSSAILIGGNCIVQSPANVVIQSGGSMTLQDFLQVQTGATLTFQNNAPLVQINNGAVNTGNVNVNRNSTALMRLDYTLWSSPVNAQNLLAFSPLTFNNAPSNIRFYTYNTDSNHYSNISNVGATNFDSGKGYLIRMPNNHPTTPTVWNGVFTGIPNNGIILAPISYVSATQIYNTIGNPYPSPINMTSFVAANSANINETLRFWRKTNSVSTNTGYSTWNGGVFTIGANFNTSSIPGNVMQTGQGFMVEAKPGATSVVFNNSMRLLDSVNQFFKSSTADQNAAATPELDFVWLNLLRTAEQKAQMAVGYRAEASNGVDRFDACTFNDAQIALSSLINNVGYTIESRATPDANTADIIPLQVRTPFNATYVIELDHSSGFLQNEDTKIYLKDKANSLLIDLKQSGYSFSAVAGNFKDRFELHIGTKAVQNAAAQSAGFVVYKDNTDLVLNSGMNIMSSVKVYDILGRLYYEKSNVNASELRFSGSKSNEVLIIKTTFTNGEQVVKKVLN